MQNFSQVRVPEGADVKASDAKSVSIPQLPRPWVAGLLRGGHYSGFAFPSLSYFPTPRMMHFTSQRNYCTQILVSGAILGEPTLSHLSETPVLSELMFWLTLACPSMSSSQAESAEISPWVRSPTRSVSSPQFSLAPTVCFLLWVFHLCSAPPLVTSLPAPNTPFPALFNFIAYCPAELQMEEQIWLHVRSVPFTLTFVLCCLPCLAMLALHLLQKNVACSLKHTRQPIFKALTFKGITFFHSTRDKSCRTENNMSLVGGLREHPDLTQWTVARTKDSSTKKFVTTNTVPPSPTFKSALRKCYQEFGLFKHEPPVSLHSPVCSKLQCFCWFDLTVCRAHELLLSDRVRLTEGWLPARPHETRSCPA